VLYSRVPKETSSPSFSLTPARSCSPCWSVSYGFHVRTLPTTHVSARFYCRFQTDETSSSFIATFTLVTLPQ